jgi:hypothetical protein
MKDLKIENYKKLRNLPSHEELLSNLTSHLDLWVEILYQIKHKNVRKLPTMGPNLRDIDVI